MRSSRKDRKKQSKAGFARILPIGGKLLRFHGATVFYSDEHAQDPTFIPKEDLVRRSEVLIVGVPHSAYRGLVIPTEVEVIDTWGILDRGTEPRP